jgi:CDP-glycerol glycerophosphotransferase
VAAVDHVSRFLADKGLRVSKAFYDRSVIGADLRFFLEVLPDADEEYRLLFLELVNDFLDRADAWALDQRSAINRLKWQLVRRRALTELLEVLRFEDEDLGEVPPIRRGRRWYGDYPYRTDERLRIPQEVYRLEEELAPVARLRDVRWEGDALRIEGYAYVDLIGAPEAGAQKVELVARRVGSRFSRIRLRTAAVHRPDVTANSAQQLANLDWSGFVATLDADQLKRRGRWREGSWEIGVVLRAGGVVRKIWRLDPEPLFPMPLARLSENVGTLVRVGARLGEPLTVRVQRNPPMITSYVLDGAVLQLNGEAGSVRGEETRLRVSRAGGTARLEYPVYIDRPGERPTFLARVPLADLIHEIDVVDEGTQAEEQGEGVAWEVHLTDGRNATRLLLQEEAAEAAFAFGGREIVVERTSDGDCAIIERSFHPVIDGVEWSPAGALHVTGSFRGTPGEYELVLGARGRTETYGVPVLYEPDTGRFSAQVTPAAVPSLAGTHPFTEGLWTFRLGRRDNIREAGVNALVDHDLFAKLPLSAERGHKRFHFGVGRNDVAVLAVERDLDEHERGGFRQRGLRTSFYPSQRTRELRQVVLYGSFGGREYSDSPRAIHEELVRRGAPLDHLWVVRDAAFDVPDTAVAVRELSREYYRAYAEAQYIVANDHWPRWFVRRRDQTCVQAWHGAPLKRHGHDLADWPRAVREYRRVLTQRADNWQYVLSPGSFATPVLERAFPVGGEIVETGLPRTDLLHRDGEHAAELRRRLGLADKRVILYAPTYRDDLDYGVGRRGTDPRTLPTYRVDSGRRDGYRLGRLLDVGALRAALGKDDVVLFRKHPLILDALPAEAEACVVDVSAFPDTTDLLLVADVLVTDYSSLLFDFASTGRPIVLFTPDFENYRDEIRGFSLDFEAIAPGPLLRTTEEVISALRDPAALREGFRERYESFVVSFCPLADGKAAARVVDRIFS